MVYTRQGDYESAVKELLRAIQLSPKLRPAHANLGVAWFQQGRSAEDREALDRAVALGYRTAQVYANRAAARQALGARNDLAYALAIDPSFAPAGESLVRLERIIPFPKFCPSPD